jgi:glycolate oxidase FAD binding subunit
MTSPVPPELADACAEVRLAGDHDQAGWPKAQFAAEPASTAEAAALLRAAADLGLSVVPRGAGRRLSWGARPGSCDLIVGTARLDRILEHAAGDLVVSVQAGVSLDVLQDRLAAEGQRLALDPPGGATIGGLIASGVAGPLRFRYGAPRDLLIGITVIRADGTAAKAGGKVVKNVAGYDLGKLFAGSYGTLGLITEATFRLHPRPAASACVTVECQDAQEATDAVHAAASSPLAPSAIELHWPSAVAPLTVAVLLEGDEEGVGERTARLGELLPGSASATTRASASQASTTPASTSRASARPRWWGEAGDAGQTVLRAAFWPGELGPALTAIRAAAASTELDPAVSGSAAAGLLHVTLDGHVPGIVVREFLGRLRASVAEPGPSAPSGSVIVLHAPPEVRDATDMWGPLPAAGLMRAIKDQFDPGHRMAPGRFAGVL